MQHFFFLSYLFALSAQCTQQRGLCMHIVCPHRRYLLCLHWQYCFIFFFVVSCRLLARCLLSTNIQHPIYSVVVVAVNSENRSQQCVLWCERSSFLSVDQVIQTYTMLLYGSRVYAATDVAFTARKWQRKIINKNQKKKNNKKKYESQTMQRTQPREY